MSTIAEMTPAPGSEGARRVTVDPVSHAPSGAPDPEVSEQAKRRRFTAEYKIRILREADACKRDGDLGALLRREGLYSSHLSSWRRPRDEITKAGLKARKRGPKSNPLNPKIKSLELENARLRRRLEEAETIIDFQKKLSKLLGISLNSPNSEGND